MPQQDYFFLEDYVRYKSKRLLSVPIGDVAGLRMEAASILTDADTLVTAGKSYIADLHGHPSDLAEENRNLAELAYGNVLQNASQSEDWYNLNVISIPCVYVCIRPSDSKSLLICKIVLIRREGMADTSSETYR